MLHDGEDALDLQVIFRKRDTNYRALVRKMIYKFKASYASPPSCASSMCICMCMCMCMCMSVVIYATFLEKGPFQPFCDCNLSNKTCYNEYVYIVSVVCVYRSM